jgi:pentatricopeptide repeat protein
MVGPEDGPKDTEKPLETTPPAKRKNVPAEECLVLLAQRLPAFDGESLAQHVEGGALSEGDALWQRNKTAVEAIQTANLSVSEWASLIKSASETSGQAATMFNTVLHAYAAKQEWNEALDMLDEMKYDGCEPDVVSYSAAAVACYRAGERRQADLVLEEAENVQTTQKSRRGQKARRNVKRKHKEKVDVVYEDDDIIAVNKPIGMLVHPGPGASGGDKNTLCDALLWHCGDASLSTINGLYARGIVHRLDRGTSGLIVAAKNNLTHALLLAEWQQNEVGECVFLDQQSRCRSKLVV